MVAAVRPVLGPVEKPCPRCWDMVPTLRLPVALPSAMAPSGSRMAGPEGEGAFLEPQVSSEHEICESNLCLLEES